LSGYEKEARLGFDVPGMIVGPRALVEDNVGRGEFVEVYNKRNLAT